MGTEPEEQKNTELQYTSFFNRLHNILTMRQRQTDTTMPDYEQVQRADLTAPHCVSFCDHGTKKSNVSSKTTRFMCAHRALHDAIAGWQPPVPGATRCQVPSVKYEHTGCMPCSPTGCRCCFLVTTNSIRAAQSLNYMYMYLHAVLAHTHAKF